MANKPTTDAARFRTPPQRSAEFAHLPLHALRDYRSALTQEETRVSYWRRIIQARLDLIRSTEGGVAATVDTLHKVFAEQRVDSGRTMLMTILPDDDMPPLPDLALTWAREPLPGDDEHNRQLVEDLARVERQLSAYRAALHKRLASATHELIARYRERPELCLTALPTQRSAARAVNAV